MSSKSEELSFIGFLQRHSRESGNPRLWGDHECGTEIPAFAGMTGLLAEMQRN